MDQIDQQIEKMFENIAESANLGYRKTGFVRTESYELVSKTGVIASFMAMKNPVKGEIRFVTRNLGSFGPYSLTDLKTKAKNEILVKVVESVQKK